MRRAHRFLPLLVSFVCALAVTTGCGEGKGRQATNRGSSALAVDVLVVQPQVLEHKIYTTGTLIANEEVELRPEISGRITNVYFKEGSRVRGGDILLRINDRELKAELSRKQLEEKLASDNERRAAALVGRGLISQEEYDRVANTLSIIQAERGVVESQLAKTEILAPFDGVVGLRHVSEGGYASPAMLAATMQDTDPMKIEFSVPEKYSRQLRNGTEITLRAGDAGEEYRGRVYAIESKIDPGTRTIAARATTPNPEGHLIPGAFAKIEITLETVPDALVIPTEALIPRIDGQIVFVCADGRAKAVPVQTGIRTERGIQVTDGLAPEDTLILTGLMQMADGKPVRPQPRAADSTSQPPPTP